jgi:TPR repeat protein
VDDFSMTVWQEEFFMRVRETVSRKIFFAAAVAVMTAAILGMGAWKAAALPDLPAEDVYKKGFDSYLDGDYKTALSYFKTAANEGNYAAMAEIGRMYERGYGVDKDANQAKNWFGMAYDGLYAAADAGNTRAQYLLGRMFYNGFYNFDSYYGYADADYGAAARWYLKAAAAGDMEAQNNLGTMYKNGQGVPPDDAEAVSLFKKSAAQGLANAQINLGTMYAEGRGVKKDEDQAAALYRKAAKRGNADAQYNLGDMYVNGRGVKKDDTQAAAWFEKAAAQGHADASAALKKLGVAAGGGNAAAASVAGTPEFESAKRAAEGGAALSQYMLAGMYEKGEGIAKNAAEAAKWYEKAAAQGNAMAQNRLGEMCRDGVGVTKNEAKAREWFGKAAKSGHAQARASLDKMNGGVTIAATPGAAATVVDARSKPITVSSVTKKKVSTKTEKLYSQGKAFLDKRVWSKAFSSLLKAAEGGHPDAQYWVSRMYADGLGVGVSEKNPRPKLQQKAKEWLTKAAEAKQAMALNDLGAYYKVGNSYIPRDRAKAMALFQEAAANGSIEAAKNLELFNAAGVAEIDRDPENIAYLTPGSWFDGLWYVANDLSSASLREQQGLTASTSSGSSNSSGSGSLYSQGEAFLNKGDVASAFDRFLRAAQDGHAGAQYYVAIMSANGIGTAKDVNAGAIWMYAAAGNGSQQARQVVANSLGKSVNFSGQTVRPTQTVASAPAPSRSSVSSRSYEDEDSGDEIDPAARLIGGGFAKFAEGEMMGTGNIAVSQLGSAIGAFGNQILSASTTDDVDFSALIGTMSEQALSVGLGGDSALGALGGGTLGGLIGAAISESDSDADDAMEAVVEEAVMDAIFSLF